MPLAGRMKLNTFIAMLAAGVATCGAAAVIVGPLVLPEPEPAPAVVAPVKTSTTTSAVTASSSATPEAVVMQYAAMNLGMNKKKDVTAGKPFKINLYQDDGHSVMNRAKIDLDRDDKWDEKWTFDGGTITRKVSPADDERYTVEQTWSGSEWR